VGGSGLYLEAALSPDRLMEVPRNDELRAELEAQDRAALVARLRNLKSDLHNKTDLEVRDRTIRAIEIAEYSEKHSPEHSPPIAPLILGIRRPRSDLRTRIAARLEARFEAGLLEEVESLRKQGVDWERLELLGLEYRYVSEFLRGQIESRNDLYQKLRSAILQFAKRQETWFRRMERKGFEIHWIDRADPEKSLEWVREYL
jgi:tRNA dimethylallyltransferase